MIPFGAQTIIDLRSKGRVPALPVLVSLVGRIHPFDGACVVAQPGQAYDWSFIRGLETHVWARKGVDLRGILLALAAADAYMLQVWDVDLRAGAFVMVDRPPETDERIASAIEASNQRRARALWQKRFEGPGIELWLAPWGDVMNSNYAHGASEYA
jgi:hypothetical protein